MKWILFCFGILLSFSNYSQTNRYTKLTTSTYKGMSYDDYAYLARIKRERMCQNFINEVKRNADHTSTYSYQSSAIYDVKFYEGTLQDDSEVYFSIVRFKTKYGGPSKEYIYQGNVFTEENYRNNYKYSPGKAFYKYIYKYNTFEFCSINESLSQSAIYDQVNNYSSSSYSSTHKYGVTSKPKQQTNTKEKNGKVSLNGWEYFGKYLYKSKTFSYAVIYSDAELNNRLYEVDNDEFVLVVERINKGVFKIWYFGSYGYISASMLKNE